MKGMAVILHNIRSAHNVGSIMRTADAAGVSEMYMTGHTPTPIDRFGRPQKEVVKTALGAHETLLWKKGEALEDVIKELRAQKRLIIGVEQDPKSIHYMTYLHNIPSNQPVVFVFGNEVDGLSREDRELCDLLIEIPMHGKKESLNVSVAAGVVLFAFRSCV